MTVSGEESILFVCRANVCRSPVAEHLASDALRSLGLSVSSAGTDADADHELCSRASDFLAGYEGGRAFAQGHRSTRLTAPAIGRASLILTASIRERSLVARLDPEARSRTFTIVEFDRLLSILPMVSGNGSFPALVAQLHHLRWNATSENWPKPTWPNALKPRRASDGLSLRDPHMTRGSIHASVLAETQSRLASIGDGLHVHLAPGALPSTSTMSVSVRPSDDSRHAV